MPDSSVATAADYADAMLVARRAKSALVLLLLLMLLVQLGLFFTARFSDILFAPAPAAAEATGSTLPALETPAVASTPVAPVSKWVDPLHYLLAGVTFLSLTLSIVLALVLYLITQIMLVGRLIGVARVTSAFIWCLVFIVLIFPWQAFLRDAAMTSREFMIPGVLYTWDELLQFARFENGLNAGAILKWARFAGFPILAVLILLAIQVKSNRGLRQALGEDDLSALARS
ncbi:MAG: hypothetical protein NZ561_12635 [Phycisphaerae bacterium]|nr:hypothetical protein [Phycisphaerae bacterium]MDW8261810.1 hypothetical protein [Phycisphaerales bacterium]